jgi:hypothetical protein
MTCRGIGVFDLTTSRKIENVTKNMTIKERRLETSFSRSESMKKLVQATIRAGTMHTKANMAYLLLPVMVKTADIKTKVNSKEYMNNPRLPFTKYGKMAMRIIIQKVRTRYLPLGSSVENLAYRPIRFRLELSTMRETLQELGTKSNSIPNLNHHLSVWSLLPSIS